jgi:cell division inhibitor SepF
MEERAMGSWRKMGAFLGLVPEDEQPGESYEESDAYRGSDYGAYRTDDHGSYRSDDHGRDVTPAGGAPGRARPRSSYAEPVTQGSLAVQPRPVPARAETYLLGESTSGVRPQTVKLTGFGEARIIGERYREGSWVILDMTDLSDSDARRVVDFAAGLAFALRGSIDKVTTRVFMLIPPDADVSAEDRRAFAGSYASR